MNINRVIVTGNLTRDPELRTLPSGTDVCSLRIAVNGRRKDSSGEWVDRPNFFDVSVFGGQAAACAQYLAKGRPCGIDGRLEWREWETDDGGKRQAVEIVAESVQFLGSRDGDNDRDTSDHFTPASSAADSDIPFVPSIDGLGN